MYSSGLNSERGTEPVAQISEQRKGKKEVEASNETRDRASLFEHRGSESPDERGKSYRKTQERRMLLQITSVEGVRAHKVEGKAVGD